MPLTTPYPPDIEPRRRRRAGLVLGGVAVLIIIVLVVLIAFLLGRGPGSSQPPAPGIPVVPSAPPPGPDAGGWDVAAETVLATRPMLDLPDQAGQPHELTTATAGPPLILPGPTQTAGRWIPGGFPASSEGAVAQLAALDEGGLAGGDPVVFAHAYQTIALPGAPAGDSTVTAAGLREFRGRAGLAATGAVPGLEVTYKVTDGLIKGTADGGRYAVVCVLGELTVGYQGQSITGGIGDCQAMRYVDDQWHISPGAPAAKAPNAWPGSAEAVAAGYRAVK
jgi:hypothetical protein